MKAGSFATLNHFSQELTRQAQTKRDYIAPLSGVLMNGHAVNYRLNLSGIEKDVSVEITDLCHQQISESLQIPRSYYNTMKQYAPELLRKNVNHWLEERQAEKRLIRTLDGKSRAFLSDRYKPLDNYDLVDAILPVIANREDIKIAGFELTETNLYLKCLTPKIEAEIKPGDIVQAGIVISNSEVGLGALKIEPMVYRLVCSNGMISSENVLRKAHLGKRFDLEGQVFELLQDETKRKIDETFWATAADLVRSAISQNGFEKIVSRMKEAAETKVQAAPNKVVEVLASDFSWSKPEKESILQHLFEGGDISQWGYTNAVTRAAQDVSSYDRSIDLERMGGRILDLPHNQIDRLIERSHKVVKESGR